MKSDQKNIDRVWLSIFITAIIILTTLPYLVAFANQGNSWQFTGFLFGVEDGNSYLAKMQRGGAGEWLFRLAYSARPGQGSLAFFPFLL